VEMGHVLCHLLGSVETILGDLQERRREQGEWLICPCWQWRSWRSGVNWVENGCSSSHCG
jgi:hypothetical protein